MKKLYSSSYVFFIVASQTVYSNAHFSECLSRDLCLVEDIAACLAQKPGYKLQWSSER